MLLREEMKLCPTKAVTNCNNIQYHSSQSRIAVRSGRPQKWDSGIAYSGHRYLSNFLMNYMNSTIKYKQTYIFLNKKRLYLI